ncbi:MAG: response regulator [Eggerthellaceae bacterium]|nr:response regulator [Eggerthellaceae bacterium]
MDKDKTKGITRNRILASLAAVVIVIIALLLFMAANTNRIYEQNARYLEGSTEQTARRINDLLSTSLGIIESAATVYENNSNVTDQDPAEIAAGIDMASFDYTFFTTVEGEAYRNDGLIENVVDREYFILGMRGESGICAYASAAFGEENIMVFFSPVFHNGNVVGVMSGVYREDTLSTYMNTEFFGVETSTFLCSSDGMIVARSIETDTDFENVFMLLESSRDTSISIQELREDFEAGIPASFVYNSNAGGGSTYATKLADFDWMLMRSFPETITNNMLENANFAGIILVAGVITAAGLLIIVLMVQSRKRQNVLLLERQEATRIIDASTNLFHSLLEVNLVENSYQYLKDEENLRNLPNSGSFDFLRNTLAKSANEEYTDVVLKSLDPDHIKRELKSGDPFYQFEYHIDARDEAGQNKELWMQVSVLALARNNAGDPINILIAVQDVTEVKAREAAQRVALQEAFRAAEYASQAKSDFLNSMSHDIRTPMNSIMGMTAIASMHVNEPDRVSDCLANISSASHHLLGLINEVLDMAKIESGNISLAEEDFEISEMVENLMTIVHPQVEAKNQDLRTELVSIKHENVIGDPTRLQQVFVNIMGNAVKFTPEGGKIIMRIRELESRIHGSACYEFQFEDTGCGMSEEFLETIFEPFTRANDSRVTKVEGTGLGMSIVKSVIDLMNGSIDVESELGVGTTFTVTVHLKLRDTDEEDLSDIIKGHVLVVDDEEATCQVTCEMLNDIGMTSEYALSGRAGVEAVLEADKTDTPFNTVILDWRMPGMSGVEAAREIREKAKNHIPIIILSGYDWSLIESEARAVGVNAFIMKPLFRSRLIKVMRELLSGKKENPLDRSAILEGCEFDEKHILLTEDNAMAAEIASEIIGMTGAKVTHAENGRIAYELLINGEPGEYDLVLMDIQMPVMNGYEAAKAIRDASTDRPDLAKIPIIALSADAFAEDMKHAKASGMNAHIAKPLEIDSLVKVLGYWLEQS